MLTSNQRHIHPACSFEAAAAICATDTTDLSAQQIQTSANIENTSYRLHPDYRIHHSMSLVDSLPSLELVITPSDPIAKKGVVLAFVDALVRLGPQVQFFTAAIQQHLGVDRISPSTKFCYLDSFYPHGSDVDELPNGVLRRGFATHVLNLLLKDPLLETACGVIVCATSVAMQKFLLKNQFHRLDHIVPVYFRAIDESKSMYSSA